MKPIGLLICQSKNTPPSERAKGAGGGVRTHQGRRSCIKIYLYLEICFRFLLSD